MSLFGIRTGILLVAWLAYCKPLNDALGIRNIGLVHWFCAIPFAILIFIFDEGRKALMRSIDASCTKRWTKTQDKSNVYKVGWKVIVLTRE